MALSHSVQSACKTPKPATRAPLGLVQLSHRIQQTADPLWVQLSQPCVFWAQVCAPIPVHSVEAEVHTPGPLGFTLLKLHGPGPGLSTSGGLFLHYKVGIIIVTAMEDSGTTDWV